MVRSGPTRPHPWAQLVCRHLWHHGGAGRDPRRAGADRHRSGRRGAARAREPRGAGLRPPRGRVGADDPRALRPCRGHGRDPERHRRAPRDRPGRGRGDAQRAACRRGPAGGLARGACDGAGRGQRRARAPRGPEGRRYPLHPARQPDPLAGLDELDLAQLRGSTLPHARVRRFPQRAVDRGVPLPRPSGAGAGRARRLAGDRAPPVRRAADPAPVRRMRPPGARTSRNGWSARRPAREGTVPDGPLGGRAARGRVAPEGGAADRITGRRSPCRWRRRTRSTPRPPGRPAFRPQGRGPGRSPGPPSAPCRSGTRCRPQP